SALSTTGFSILPGMTSTLDAALATAPQSTVNAAWDHDSFKQLGGSINPSSAITGEEFEVLASPIPFTNGVFGTGSAPLLYDDARNAGQIGSGVESVTATPVNPFASSWP